MLKEKKNHTQLLVYFQHTNNQMKNVLIPLTNESPSFFSLLSFWYSNYAKHNILQCAICISMILISMKRFQKCGQNNKNIPRIDAAHTHTNTHSHMHTHTTHMINYKQQQKSYTPVNSFYTLKKNNISTWSSALLSL